LRQILFPTFQHNPSEKSLQRKNPAEEDEEEEEESCEINPCSLRLQAQSGQQPEEEEAEEAVSLRSDSWLAHKPR
jgi:hypothetical protein